MLILLACGLSQQTYYGENYEEDHSSNERKPSTKLYPASRLLLAILQAASRLLLAILQAASRLTHEYGKSMARARVVRGKKM